MQNSIYKIKYLLFMLNKYLKCSVWRLAVWYDIYIYMSLGFKRLSTGFVSHFCHRRMNLVTVRWVSLKKIADTILG